MLHPRDHFLTDITALGEVDAVQNVEPDIMGKGLIGRKVIALVGDADADTFCLIEGIVLNPVAGGRDRGNHAPADIERAIAIGVTDPCRFRILGKADAVALAQIVNHRLGAQAVHFHALEEIVGHRLMHVHPDGVFGLTSQALGQNFALGREQGPGGSDFPNAISGGGDRAGHHIIEQLVGLGARKTEYGTVGAQMGGHGRLPLGRCLR